MVGRHEQTRPWWRLAAFPQLVRGRSEPHDDYDDLHRSLQLAASDHEIWMPVREVSSDTATKTSTIEY